MPIITTAEINIFNPVSIQNVRKNLLELSNSLHVDFTSQSQELLKAAGVPILQDNSKGDDIINVKSFINGMDIYSIKKTSPQEYNEIHKKSVESSRLWHKLPVAARVEFFRIMAEEVGMKYKPLIDLLITLEVGKAGSEFSKMAEWDKWVISKEVLEQITDNIYAVDGYNKKYSREDILNGAIDNIGSEISFYEVKSGIVGGTNGFNYPAALAVPDIVLSRINGNSFVGKVPSKSPSFLFIRKIIENETINLMVERFGGYGWARDAKSRGIDFSDSNIVNIIKDGFQIIAGRQIIESWAKNCMTFRLVGGEIAGKVYHGYREEVDANLEKTILELAGNNPAVIMGSAKNLEGGLQKIVDNLAAGNKGNSGQRCTSPRRWLAHAEIYEELKDLIIREYRLSEKNGDNAIGNPLDESFKYGAMDKGGFDKAWEYLQEVTKLGALVIGGNRVLVDKFPDAYYMTPALVIWDNVPKDKQNIIHDKEIFAPIANLLIIHDVEHAIAESNKSIDKLSGGFYCDSDHQREFELFKSKTNLGSLIYNGPPKDQSPKGVHAGRERAGMGVTGGLDSIKQYQASPELIRKCSAKEAKEYIKKQMSVH